MLRLKVTWWKKLLCINSHHIANLNFLFLSLFVYLFKNCPFQFLSHWELDEPVFCSEELSCLHYKTQTKSVTLSLLPEKFKFALYILKCFFHQANFNKIHVSKSKK